MSFQNLSCQQFGKFSQQQFQLSRVTLFLGANEAGKTTLCDAFLYALCSNSRRFSIFRRYGKAQATLSPAPRQLLGDPNAALQLAVVRAADFSFTLDHKSTWQAALQEKLFAAGINPDALIQLVKTSLRRYPLPNDVLQQISEVQQKNAELENKYNYLTRQREQLYHAANLAQQRYQILDRQRQYHEILQQEQELEKLLKALLATKAAQRFKATDVSLIKSMDQLHLRQAEQQKLSQELQQHADSFDKADQELLRSQQRKSMLQTQLQGLLYPELTTSSFWLSCLAAVLSSILFYSGFLQSYAGQIAGWLTLALLWFTTAFLFMRLLRNKSERKRGEQTRIRLQREIAEQESVSPRLRVVVQQRNQLQQTEQEHAHAVTSILNREGLTSTMAAEQALQAARQRIYQADEAASILGKAGFTGDDIESQEQELKRKLEHLRTAKNLLTKEPMTFASSFQHSELQASYLQWQDLTTQCVRVDTQLESLPLQLREQQSKLSQLHAEYETVQEKRQAHEIVLQIFQRMQTSDSEHFRHLEQLAQELLLHAGLSHGATLRLDKWKNDALYGRDRAGGERLLEHLSTSTQALYYLALRLVALRLLKMSEPLLLLDEPFAHFDQERTHQALKLLQEACLEQNLDLVFFSKDQTLQRAIVSYFPDVTIHCLDRS